MGRTDAPPDSPPQPLGQRLGVPRAVEGVRVRAGARHRRRVDHRAQGVHQRVVGRQAGAVDPDGPLRLLLTTTGWGEPVRS